MPQRAERNTIAVVKTASGARMSVEDAKKEIGKGITFVTAVAVVAEVEVDSNGHLRTVSEDTGRNNLDSLPKF